MFLDRIKDKLKIKAARKFLKQELDNPLGAPNREKGIRSIGCIVDLDAVDNVNVFQELIEEFSLNPNAVRVIGYKEFYDNSSPYATPIFSDKDLGWKAQIGNSYATEFLSRDYDLLINYYTGDKLLPQLLTIQSKARLRVGIDGTATRLNDLIINTPAKDFQVFKKELIRYLRILNQL